MDCGPTGHYESSLKNTQTFLLWCQPDVAYDFCVIFVVSSSRLCRRGSTHSAVVAFSRAQYRQITDLLNSLAVHLIARLHCCQHCCRRGCRLTYDPTTPAKRGIIRPAAHGVTANVWNAAANSKRYTGSTPKSTCPVNRCGNQWWGCPPASRRRIGRQVRQDSINHGKTRPATTRQTPSTATATAFRGFWRAGGHRAEYRSA